MCQARLRAVLHFSVCVPALFLYLDVLLLRLSNGITAPQNSAVVILLPRRRMRSGPLLGPCGAGFFWQQLWSSFSSLTFLSPMRCEQNVQNLLQFRPRGKYNIHLQRNLSVLYWLSQRFQKNIGWFLDNFDGDECKSNFDTSGF